MTNWNDWAWQITELETLLKCTEQRVSEIEDIMLEQAQRTRRLTDLLQQQQGQIDWILQEIYSKYLHENTDPIPRTPGDLFT